MFALNSDLTALVAVTTISESNLNDFTSVTKPRIGRGYGLINAPWSGGSIVEYIPYGSDGSIMGLQRITSIVPVNGVYQSAYYALEINDILMKAGFETRVVK